MLHFAINAGNSGNKPCLTLCGADGISTIYPRGVECPDCRGLFIHPADGSRLSTNDYRHIAICPVCRASFGADVVTMAQDVAGAGRDVSL